MSVQYHKVTPIYQCIDSGNWKGAVKLCQRKDVEQWDITRALLAYCLNQLDRAEQALETALAVKANEPTDEGALSALTLTFKAMGRHMDAVECYENAARKCPSNEAFAIETLNCYAGLGEFKKMQQGSQKMYKSSGNSKYVFWSVSCMLLQEYPLAMLDLAEKMLFKVFDGDKKSEQPGAEELALLVEIFRNRAAHPSVEIEKKCEVLERCLECIQDLSSRRIAQRINDETMVKVRDGGDGSLVKSHPQHLQLLQIQILKDLNNYQQSIVNEESIEKCKRSTVTMVNLLNEVLVDLPDQWDALETLVQVKCDAHSKQNCLCKENDGKVNCIESFHDEILLMQKKHPSARGTFLAEMYFLQEVQKVACNTNESGLWWLETKSDDPDDEFVVALSNMTLSSDAQIPPAERELVRLLMQYVTKFETKQCCFTDVKPYLSTLLSRSEGKEGSGTCSVSVAAQVLQSWSRSRVSMLTAEIEMLTSSTNEKDDEILVKSATLLLCRLSKLMQIDMYFSVNVDSTSGDVDSNSISTLKKLYADTYGMLAGKGIGGLREVQPGDELLMLWSTELWQGVSSTPTNTVDSVAKCLEWTESIVIGREASPHNYCFPVEGFEPLRRLACVEYAMDSFNKLEVKYIQLDSMTYLVLPALLEGGFFTEFHRLSKNIVKFHEGAKRDTLSMVGKCLKNANYAKALELGKFAKKCQNSMQLALTRSELPLLEVVEELHTASDVLTYLQSYVTDMKPESQAELSESEIDNLDENMDYGLLTTIDESADKAMVYRQQYKHRILASQSFLRLMMSFLQDASDGTIDEHLNACWTNQFDSTSSFGVLGDGSSGEPVLSEVDSTLKWSQAIDFGSQSVERNVWMVTIRLCYLSSLCVQVVKSRGEFADASGDARLATIRSICGNVAQAIASLEAELLGTVDNRFVSFEGTNVILQPAWIKQMSGVVRVLLCWGAVILSSARQQMGGASDSGKSASKKKKNKKAKAADASANDTTPEGKLVNDVKECFLSTTRLFKTFTDGVNTALSEEMHDSSRMTETVLPYLNAILPSHVTTGESANPDSVVDEKGNISFVAARIKLAKHILSSQTLSCTRLSDSVQKKIPLLQNFSNGF